MDGEEAANSAKARESLRCAGLRRTSEQCRPRGAGQGKQLTFGLRVGFEGVREADRAAEAFW